MLRFIFAGLTLAALFFCSAPHALATILTYDNRVAFYAAIDAAPNLARKTEGWDAFGSGSVIRSGWTVNGISYYSPLGDFKVSWLGQSTSPPSTLGAAWRPGLSGFYPGEAITFAFEAHSYAFGISFNTFAREMGPYAAINEWGDGASSYYDPFPGSDTGQFLGFISDRPFSTIDLSALPYPPGPNTSWGLDDLTYAVRAAVPEPGTFFLLGMGVIGFTVIRHRSIRSM